jgi:hypothetical protein
MMEWRRSPTTTTHNPTWKEDTKKNKERRKSKGYVGEGKEAEAGDDSIGNVMFITSWKASSKASPTSSKQSHKYMGTDVGCQRSLKAIS